MNRSGTFLSQCLPCSAREPRFRRLSAFDVNQTVCVQHRTDLKLLAEIPQQILCEGRIEKNDVVAAFTAGNEGRGLHCMTVGLTIGLQCSQGGSHPAQHIRVTVDKGAVGGPARQCFDTQRAAARKQVEAAGARDIGLQPVKQGFPNAVGGGTESLRIGNRQSTAPPATTNNTDVAACLMPRCGSPATCRHFFTLRRDGRIYVVPGASLHFITVTMKFFKRKKHESAPDDATAATPPEASDEAVASPAPQPAPAERPTSRKADGDGFFARLRRGLGRTSDNLVAGVGNLFLGRKEIDAELLEELESRLLMADLGVEATMQTIERLTQRVSRKELLQPDALGDALREELFAILEPCEKPLEVTGHKPYVILMVGVNGVGKTTTIGKLANRYRDQGLSVMLAAGDTFRAAAVEQLQVWGERNQVPVVAQHTGADSASVLFDALASARAREVDVLIADTAGRLHNKDNLMEELRKVVRVLRKQDSQAPHEVMLVLDAGTGQNALAQASHFTDAVGVTGITLTKLDGTAKGGIIFAIAQKLGLPIRYIGVGETAEDLRPFAAREFIDALFDRE